MEIVAKSESVRVNPRKVRLVADTVRNLSVQKALTLLTLLRKRGASPVQKTIKSAVANAVNNAKISPEGLVIKSIQVNEGPVLKRFHPSTRGRVHPYKKRTSHITVVLEAKK